MRHNLRLLMAVLLAMSGASVLMNLKKMLHLYSCNDQPTPAENKQNSGKMADNKNRTLLQVLWPVLRGFKGTPFNDLEQVEDFFKDRPIRWKVVLRVGNENVLAWRDGWKHLKRIKCPVTKCLFTRNTTEFNSADALVLTHFSEKEHRLFSPKPRNQVWIAQTLEPPYHFRLNATLLRGLVNWTATYRQDSTIVLPYGLWLKLDSPLESSPSKKNYARGKTKKVAMFVSNCKDISGRINYAVELNRSIGVDIYGKCGSLKCDRFKNSSACSEMLRKDYKFYLSFENSNCVDYITEKLHVNALSNDIVPIVMGARREDYVTAAPPHSFVHVDDFRSPDHLGKYLNLLDSNDALYNEYFHYKGRYRLLGLYELGTSYWCQLCTRLHVADHGGGGVVTWVEDYDKWWNGESCVAKNHRNNTWRTWKSPGS